ncbi:hypothetical protein L1887_08030 [Cichorium endivia]|nr:hypothetical protein L1887_08030 [Cichorium endivia]
MGSSSLRIQSLQTAFDSIKIDKIQVRYATTITCGLRKPMRTRRPSDGVLSTEAIQAVQSLKLAAENPSKLHQVFDSKLSRLLKDDLLDAFAELQRQQHLELVVKLVADVGVVGGVSGSDPEVVDGDVTVAGVGVFGL